MPTDKKSWVEPLLLIALTAFLTYALMPKKGETVVVHVPHIVTVHDTTKVPVPGPVIYGPKVVTTDTINLVQKVTVHDTVQIVVNDTDTSKVDSRWPVMSLTATMKVGDTTHTTTVSLRSGKLTESTIWTPGPLLGVWADTSGTPRLQFGTWPANHVPFLSAVKFMGIGAAGLVLILTILHGV